MRLNVFLGSTLVLVLACVSHAEQAAPETSAPVVEAAESADPAAEKLAALRREHDEKRAQLQQRRMALREAMQQRQALRAELMASLPGARDTLAEISATQQKLRELQESLEQSLMSDERYAGSAREMNRLMDEIASFQKKRPEAPHENVRPSTGSEVSP